MLQDYVQTAPRQLVPASSASVFARFVGVINNASFAGGQVVDNGDVFVFPLDATPNTVVSVIGQLNLPLDEYVLLATAFTAPPFTSGEQVTTYNDHVGALKFNSNYTSTSTDLVTIEDAFVVPKMEIPDGHMLYAGFRVIAQGTPSSHLASLSFRAHNKEILIFNPSK